MVSHPEPDVALTRELSLSMRRQQGLLEGVPLLLRKQSGVNYRHFSLHLDRATVGPRDF